MADDKKPQEPKNTGEAGAKDLLSLWGGASTPQAKPAPPPKAPVAIPQPPELLKPKQPQEQTPEKPEPKIASKQPKQPAETPPPRPAQTRETKKAPEAPPLEKPRPEPRGEAIEGEVIGGEEIQEPPPEGKGEFGMQLDELLEELHLSRKHIFYGVGCVVILVILIIGGIWGYRAWKAARLRPPEADYGGQATLPKPSTAIPLDATGISSTRELGSTQTSVFEGESGVSVSLTLGEEFVRGKGIGSYVMTFRRLQNAYALNIDELLSEASDRKARLDSYLALLRKLHGEGTQTLREIDFELQAVESAYKNESSKQMASDANFFEQLKVFNANTVESILEEFISASREIVTLRARFKALQKIRGFYASGLPRVNARIRDIELNRDALISGIKVYDVPGSNLNLVIPVEGEEGAVEERRDSFNTPAFPLLPIHPSQVKTDKDYITQPGGGF